MSNIRFKNNKGGFGIFQDIWLSSCSPTAFKLICFIERVSNYENQSFYSIERLRNLKIKINGEIKNIISSNRNSIVKAFKELESLNFIKRTKKNNYYEIELLEPKKKYKIFDSIKSDTFISIKSDTFVSIESDTLTNNKVNEYKVNLVNKVLGLVNLLLKDFNNNSHKYKYRINDFEYFIKRELEKRGIDKIKYPKAYILKLIDKYKYDFLITKKKQTIINEVENRKEYTEADELAIKEIRKNLIKGVQNKVRI